MYWTYLTDKNVCKYVMAFHYVCGYSVPQKVISDMTV